MGDIKYIDLKDNESVEFHIYPNLSKLSEEDKDHFVYADKMMTSIQDVAKKLSESYIWHNDEFQISLKNVTSCIQSNIVDCEPFSFCGTVNYGENIEDEWFVVYLLVELTKRIDGLIAQVKDGDGEFLLIEAAEQLPSWVTPETSEGRTFIYKGELHILPLEYEKGNDNFTVTSEVLQYIRDFSDEIKCDASVQKAIEYKISDFSSKTLEKYHNAILYVPVAVASLLNLDETLIAPAVRAFCDRDLFDIKACRAMKYFPPENRVYTQVKFTKLLYVMLVTSKYIPDKRTGWNLPAQSDEKHKAHLLGIKLACGFEILLNQAKNEGCAKSVSNDFDFNSDPKWKQFLKSLTEKNYFRGLLEHSREYKELFEKAHEYYVKSYGKSFRPSRAKMILDMVNKLEVDIEELKKKEMNLPKSDDDSWMNISQEELDLMLKKRFGFKYDGGDSEECGASEIPRHLDDFINHVSDVDGAEFPKRSKGGTSALPKNRTPKKRKSVKFSPDTKMSDVPSSGVSSETNNIHFEPEGFINAIQNILDFSIPDDNYWDSEGSDMSSYEDEADLDRGGKSKSKYSKKKDELLMQYMTEMDKELSKTTLGQSFVHKNTAVGRKGEKLDGFEDAEDFKPVDIDLNALKNVISSYKAQLGDAGPAENLLGPLGVRLDSADIDVD